MRELTLLSLFDGSGGFPLAASMCGIRPVACSEVEPYPIAVTKSRFPNMKHLGSVTDINGGDIEPVDIITFGSPCQDLSVAGKRAGLKHEANGDEETTRSGLFMEAVRIIKEMREATNGEYPTFAVWENVPGAFSSNKGEDFRTVLQELIRIVEPTAVMPAVPKNGWPYADSYCGDGWSLAYRTYDAQYWGVPQRRRRIYLVLDLRGQRAGKVSFEREGVRGNFATFKTAGKGTAGDAADRTGADDCEGIGINGEVAATLDASYYKGCGMRQGIEREVVVQPVAYSFDSLASNSMKSKNPHSGCRRVEISKTFDTTDPNPCKNQGGIAIVCVKCYDARGNGDGQTVSTLTGDHENRITDYTSVVCEQIPIHDKATRYKGGGPTRNGDGAGNGLGVGKLGDPCPTLSTCDHHMVCYCMAHGQANAEILEDKSPCLNCNHEQPIVAGVDCRNLTEHPELYPTLQAKPNGGQSLNFSGAGRVQYIVRRLTPTECARLQGFPDDWGHPDHKEDFTDEEYRFWLNVRNTHAAINGKPQKDYNKAQMLTWYNKLHTDSSEYKMWGNGISLPTALYVMQGIAEALKGGACVNTNRNFIGIELDKDYFEIAKKRIEENEKEGGGEEETSRVFAVKED